MKATYVTHSGDDLLVVNAARVSFDKISEWEDCTEDACKALRESDQKLLRFLATHGHWTPFSHPQITLHIKAPIFVLRQMYKHKVGFTENEISRRYVDTKPEFYIPKVWRARAENKKQGSSEKSIDGVYWAGVRYNELVAESLDTYNTLLELGVAPEQARMVLPQSMYTELYWTGSLAAYNRFFHLRTSSDAQWEIRELARSIGDIIEPLFPYSWKALSGDTRKVD